MASPNGAVAPSQFPPPVDSAQEFIGAPTDPEDERIEVGVAIVGDLNKIVPKLTEAVKAKKGG